MKVCLCGDGAVGKTALRERYLGRGFQSKYMMTIGADFALKEEVIDNKSIKFQIWDLAGQQRFGSVRSVYYLGAMGALLLFDITRPETFENIRNWLDEIWKNNGKGKIPVVLLGNKADLRDQFPNCIENSQAEEYAKQLSEKTRDAGFEIRYLETSAKTGKNVEQAFNELGKVYFNWVDKSK